MKKALQYFYKYLKPYWKGISLVIILTLAMTYFQVVAPVYMGNTVTDLTNILKGHGLMTTFYHDLWLMIVFYGLNVLTMGLSWTITSVFNAHANNNMRKNLFTKLQKMTIKYFDTHQDGKLLSLFTSDIDNIFNAMNNAVFEIIAQSALFIGTIVMMLLINVKLALITMASTPLVVIISIVIMKKASFYLDRQQEEIGALNGYINEQINGQKVIITNGLQKDSVQGFTVQNDKARKTMFKGQFYSGLLYPLMTGLSLLNLAIVISAGALLIMTGSMSTAKGLGLLVMFVQYSQQYFQPLMQLTSIYSMMQLGLTGAKRLKEVEDQPEEDRVPNGQILTAVKKGVSLNDVHFSYNEKKEILHGVSLDVKAGKYVALVGPTGSGKTTVMNLLNRFYDVNQGSVTFDGIDVRQLTLTSLRQNVGIVLQDSVLFTGTIAENIKYGKPNATDEEMIDAAKQAQIHDFIMTLPDQYETLIGADNEIFSTGQKQLLSIARTILTNPAFLILDEATSNVDTVTEEKIQKAMDNVIMGRTSFVIAHRLKTILNADRIVVLKDGQVLEEGSHQALLAQKGFYYDLYTSQMAFE